MITMCPERASNAPACGDDYVLLDTAEDMMAASAAAGSEVELSHLKDRVARRTLLPSSQNATTAAATTSSSSISQRQQEQEGMKENDVDAEGEQDENVNDEEDFSLDEILNGLYARLAEEKERPTGHAVGQGGRTAAAFWFRKYFAQAGSAGGLFAMLTFAALLLIMLTNRHQPAIVIIDDEETAREIAALKFRIEDVSRMADDRIHYISQLRSAQSHLQAQVNSLTAELQVAKHKLVRMESSPSTSTPPAIISCPAPPSSPSCSCSNRPAVAASSSSRSVPAAAAFSADHTDVNMLGKRMMKRSDYKIQLVPGLDAKQMMVVREILANHSQGDEETYTPQWIDCGEERKEMREWLDGDVEADVAARTSTTAAPDEEEEEIDSWYDEEQEEEEEEWMDWDDDREDDDDRDKDDEYWDEDDWEEDEDDDDDLDWYEEDDLDWGDEEEADEEEQDENEKEESGFVNEECRGQVWPARVADVNERE